MRVISLLVVMVVLLIGLNGCSSIARGVTEGILASRQGETEEKKHGICAIRGPAFEGLDATLARQAAAGPGYSGKVLMVHGIGKHLPGYSGRLQDNLVKALGLNVVQSRFKEFTLLPPPPRPDLNLGDEPLGNLRIYRYTNKGQTRELLFYELTWSEITESKKAILAYDDSEEYAYRRATLNQAMKSFFNSHIPDPIIYTGNTHLRMLTAVTQSLCWVYSGDWNVLPDGGLQRCDATEGDKARHIREDEVAIITHSLGSRIAVDALQAIAQSDLRQRRDFASLARALQGKTIPIYMLANQLPLLQLGFVEPQVEGEKLRYCQPGGDRYDQRLFRQVRIVAFSDPNDILSYAIPPQFVDEHIDSQICPEAVNVTVNVTPVNSLLNLGTFANPLAAHNQYEDDARVIGLITRGIGTPDTAPVVQEDCTWLETLD